MDEGRLTRARSDALQHLLRLREEHAEVIAASQDSNADDEHDPEGATLAFERQQLQALIAQAERRLADLDVALTRARAGTYGLCAACGEPIGAARLEARPSAQTCIGCAR